MAEPNEALVVLSCNLCGSNETKIKFPASKHERKIANAVHCEPTTDIYGCFGRIVQCRSCGLVYTSPRPKDIEILAAYADALDQEYRGEASSRSINAHLSLNTIKQFVSEGSLLDVGCSTGYFLNAARLHYSITGVELSKTAAEYARNVLQIDIHFGTLETAKFSDSQFAVVTLIDVIEHLTDPLQTLKETWRILQPNGLLYVVTPNVSSATARLLGSHWWGLRPAHLFYYSSETLARTLQTTGFEVLSARAFGRVFTLGYWISRVRNYSSRLTTGLRKIMQRAGLLNKLIYVNTFDSIEVCARKKE